MLLTLRGGGTTEEQRRFYLAYKYYLRLFDKIKNYLPSHTKQAMQVPDYQKMTLLASTDDEVERMPKQRFL
jgi:hypothetical protein